ncbi:MAG TPA: ubiquinol-cytochrome c reductase iron-sulfur subunit [Baekduia sp.]|nr:ubiquinol-cytochrome c reductase iron-sulfur subunit [Baekduia sp.]
MSKQDAPSKYTAERGMPGAFEGETVSRRRFMGVTVQTAGILATSAILLPSIGFAVGPMFEETDPTWEVVGPVDDFTKETYTPKVITVAPNVGQAGKTTVYVRARDPEIDKEYEEDPKTRENFNDEEFVAISTRCMHLGCPVRFVDAARRFICPCHGGVYDFRGLVDGGPPVRPLDRFYTRVRDGQVEIGPRFSVNSELRRFSPRDAGEALDGIGQYAYPSRPTARKLSQD